MPGFKPRVIASDRHTRSNGSVETALKKRKIVCCSVVKSTCFFSERTKWDDFFVWILNEANTLAGAAVAALIIVWLFIASSGTVS